MSIRKVTDLSALTMSRIDTDKMNESVFEISYCTEYADYTKKQYQSMYITYANLQSCILSSVMPGGTLNVPNGLSGSGNFDWNMTLSDTELRTKQYHFWAKSFENKLIGVDHNILSSPHNTFCGDVQFNTLNGDDTYAKFSCDTIQIGSATQQQNIIVGSNTTTTRANGTWQATGSWTFTNQINGTCLHAKWSDVAELYESDATYEPGTLVQFGGDKEITIATTDANAVITTAPGVLLGSESEDKIKVGIALVGRVPVKVKGKVSRFQDLTLSKDQPGIAIQANPGDKVIAKTLEANDSEDVKLVESVVRLYL